MANASPDWFNNAVRVCFSDSDEDVFNANHFSWRRPAETSWTESEGQTYGHESREVESDGVRSPPYVRSVRESVSYFEGLCGNSGSTTQTSATDKSGSAQSESARQRVTSTSDGYAVITGEMPSQSCQPHVHQLERQRSIIDGLLLEIYDRSHRSRADSLDSDTFTECSSASEATVARGDGHYDPGAQQQPAKRYNRHSLQSYNTEQLQQLTRDMQRSVTQMSVRLVRQLKRRDRRAARMRRHCDVLTAILHAASLKRQIDTRMKFSVAPPSGPSAFEQWKDAMKAVNRLPMGIPAEFRKKVWLSLADHYIRRLKIDWHNTVRLAFNDRSNPDDDKLGMQIVKDLHRTGCSSFSGQDNEQDRAVLKRVLLAYARWNKRIGYCQGFNVIVALLLDVMDRKEDDALKVMIYLIDHVLPESYFDNNLRALSVDMAVFRDLLRLTLPTLSSHLDQLQHAAQDVSTGSCYEPPLTNVFTMQWFLTLFATCLPKDVVLRVWDAILLEGSEILLRTALCLWGKLARRIMNVESADEFYSLMGELSSDMMEGVIYDSDHMITAIYAVAPFPFPQLTELREKYTYNIRPFSSTPAPSHKLSRLAKAVLYSDEEEPDEEELRAMATLPGMSPGPGTKGKSTDISVVGHGVFGGEPEVVTCCKDTVYMERMSTDITALKMQYDKLRLRQRQAHVIIAAVSTKKAVEVKQRSQAPVLVSQIDSPHAMNHLFVGKVQSHNRLATKGHGLATESLPGHCAPTKQVPAQTTADPTPCGTSPAARTPTVSCSLSSSPARGGAEEDTKHFQDQSAEERLQTGDKGRQLCRVSSLEHADNNNSNVSSCTVPDTGCFAAGVGSDEQNNRQDKPCHFPSSSNSENHILGSGCCEPNTVCQSSQLQVSSEEDRTDGADDADRRRLQQVAFGGSGGHRFSQQREGGNTAVSSSADKSAGNVSSGRVLCENSELSDEQPAAFPSVPEKEEKADGELSQNVVCADFVTKTDMDKVCGEDNGFRNSHAVISRSLSLPTPSLTTKKPQLSPAATPTHRHPPLLPSINGATAVKSRHLSSPSSLKCPRPFNPFPVKHLNTNRARTGLKLGLYTPSTLEHIQGQGLGGLKKASHTS